MSSMAGSSSTLGMSEFIAAVVASVPSTSPTSSPTTLRPGTSSGDKVSFAFSVTSSSVGAFGATASGSGVTGLASV